MAGSLIQAMAALRHVDGGGSPERPKRSGVAAQPLDAPTATRHLVSSPQAWGQTSIRQRARTVRRDHEHLRIDPEKTEQSGISGQRSRQIIWEIRRQIACETTPPGGVSPCGREVRGCGLGRDPTTQRRQGGHGAARTAHDHVVPRCPTPCERIDSINARLFADTAESGGPVLPCLPAAISAGPHSAPKLPAMAISMLAAQSCPRSDPPERASACETN